MGDRRLLFTSTLLTQECCAFTLAAVLFTQFLCSKKVPKEGFESGNYSVTGEKKREKGKDFIIGNSYEPPFVL